MKTQHPMKEMIYSVIPVHQPLPPQFITSFSLLFQGRHDDAVPNFQLGAAKATRAAIRIVENLKGYAIRRHIGVQAIDQFSKLLIKRQFVGMFQKLSPKCYGETLRSTKMTSSALSREAPLDTQFSLKRAEGVA